MSEHGEHPQEIKNKAGTSTERAPLSARLLFRSSLGARWAAAIIAAFTVLVTFAGGILERLLDHQEYPTFGKGLWFALQTVTTVGYGDATPAQPSGRIIATVVMLTGIGFIAVITAAVTASLVEGRRGTVEGPSAELSDRLEEMNQRLARIETAVQRQASSGSPGDAG